MMKTAILYFLVLAFAGIAIAHMVRAGTGQETLMGDPDFPTSASVMVASIMIAFAVKLLGIARNPRP